MAGNGSENGSNGIIWTSSFAKWLVGVGITLLFGFFWFDRNAVDRQILSLSEKIDREIQDRGLAVLQVHGRADSIRVDVSTNAVNINGLMKETTGIKDLLNGQVSQVLLQVSAIREQNSKNYDDLKDQISELRKSLNDSRN